VAERTREIRKPRKLLLGYLERISSKVFSDFPKQLTDLIGKQHGVYSLYKGNRLYYVGLASNLRGRIKHHLSDKHAGRWDKFSLYLVRKADHIKELETLILRIANPKGAVKKGRLPHAVNLGSELRAQVREAQEGQLTELFGAIERTQRQRKRSKTSQRSRGKRQPALAHLVKKRFKIRATHKGEAYEATVRGDGTIRFRGTFYNSPSGTGKGAIGRAVDGWLFWRFKDREGQWVRLDELRKK